MRERRYQSYARSLMLPAAVKADKAVAEVKDGVLHLTLPKAEEAKVKTISVKAKETK
jgi:HSP20 family protein